MRTLAFSVLQFLVMVILPNNEVGTSELPAVGAKSVLCSASGCSAAPSKGKPRSFVVLFGRDRTTYAGSHSLVSRHAVISAADVLQLFRRLRI